MGTLWGVAVTIVDSEQVSAAARGTMKQLAAMPPDPTSRIVSRGRSSAAPDPKCRWVSWRRFPLAVAACTPHGGRMGFGNASASASLSSGKPFLTADHRSKISMPVS